MRARGNATAEPLLRSQVQAPETDEIVCSDHQKEVDNSPDDHAKRSLEKTIAQWDKDYINVDQAVLYFVTLAANYLNIKDLL